jgi:membrane protease YdiL (CAAX protease family)
MNIVDLVFIVLLFVVQPVADARSFRRYVARADAGQPVDRIRFYRHTMLVEWTALAVLAAAWYFLARPLADLGMVAPGGFGFWVAAALLLPLVAYLSYALHYVKHADDETRAGEIRSLGKLVHVVPHTARELRHFIGVSVTAGIVEEILYRGFVIWFLALFMPVWGAVVVSSVAFGLAHSYQGLSGGVRCGLVGLALALLYVLSGSIWVPIVAHAVLDILQGATTFELCRTPRAPAGAAQDAAPRASTL